MRSPLLAATLASPLLLVAACQTTPNPYPTPGFYETRIEEDRYRLVYRAAPQIPRDQAEDSALLRAAEMTLQNGYEWFRITGRETSVIQPRGPVISLGTGSSSFGGRSAVGVGVGTSFQLGGGPAPLLTLELQMGKGPRPDDRSAYDARDVADTIRRRI